MGYKPPVLPGGGGSGGSGGSSKALGTRQVHKLRRAITTGNEDAVRRKAKKMGLSDQNVKAIVAITTGFNPGSKSFGERVLSDAGTTLKGLPKGVTQTAVAAGKEAVAVPRLGIDIAQGDKISAARVLRAAPVVGSLFGVEEAIRTGKADKNTPFSSQAGLSLRRTGERVAHPKRAARDYSQHPFSTLLEDAGNVAIVGAGAAKLARLGGFEGAAANIERVNAAPNAIANAPFLPVSRTARLANRGIEAARTKALASDRLRPVMEHLRMTPEAKATKSVLRGQNESEHAVANRITQAFRAQEKILPKTQEQEAMYLVGQGQAEALARAQAVLPEEAFNRMVDEQLGKDFSREGVDLAIEAVSGRNPDLKGRIDEALTVGREGRAAREEGYLDRGPEARSEQLGYRPLTAEVERRTAPAIRNLKRAEKLVERTRQAADANLGKTERIRLEAEHANIPAIQRPASGVLGPSTHIPEDVTLSRQLGQANERQAILERRAKTAERVLAGRQEKLQRTEEMANQSIEAAPARLRPLLETNRTVASEIVGQENALRAAGLHDVATAVGNTLEDIPTTLKALEDAGIDVEHFINPRERTSGGTGPSRELNLPKAGKKDEARLRTGRGAHEMTIRAQAKAEVRRAHQVIADESVRQIEQLPFVKHGDEFLKQYDGSASAPRFPTRAELHEQGLEAWAPNTLFETTDKVNAQTIILPKAIHESFKSYYSPKNWEKLLRPYDAGTRAFKTVVLPLSPAWNVGNAVTNAFMATFLGGTDPVTLARMIGKSIAEHKRTGEWPGPQRLYESGSTHETLDFLGAQRLDRGRLRTAAGAPARAGYKANETIDNIFRSATYLAKKGKGYSDEAAMRISLQALGDFTKMSPFERSVVRRAVPFYAWLRHMAQVAVRMPIEHPMRTAVILALSNEFKDQAPWEQALPGFMQGFVPLGSGDTALNVQNFMPFSNPLAIQQWGTNLNPQLKLLLANLPGSPARGVNPLTGAPYTRPPGTGRQGPFGKDQPTAPSIVEQLRGIPPQARLFDQLSGRKDVARYESGDVVLVRDPKTGKRIPIPVTQSDARSISKYAGLPAVSQKQLKEIVDSILLRKINRFKVGHPAKKVGASSSGGGGGGGGGGYQPPHL